MKPFKGGAISKSTFKPHPLLKNNHLQTLWPALIRRAPRLKTKRERLITKDKDFIDIDWHEIPHRPLVLLVHGLASSSKAKYITGLQKSLAAQGFASVAMNLRGCSGEPNHRVIGYHGGAIEDIDGVIKGLKERFPDRSIAAVGFSLGASILLNWLGSKKNKQQLFAAIAVSAPLQLNLSTEKLQQGFSKIYGKYLLAFMKWNQYKKNNKLRKRSKSGERDVFNKIPALRNIKTIKDFDEYITAPIHGFKDARHYYNQCSSRQRLAFISTPTLVIHAKDDPFMPVEIIPPRREISDCVMIELSENGGHVGFVSKSFDGRMTYWLEERIPYFFQEMLSD